MEFTFFVLFVSFNVFPIHGVAGREGFGPGDQNWGYVTVRPGVHMFWWLYWVTLESENQLPNDKPLIIWLQRSPESSSGQGNFQIIGPIDIEGNLRNYTWVQDYNVLFIDSPVGTGFSYVDRKFLLTRRNSQIAKDLLECIKGFLTEFEDFRYVPTYIFSQSLAGQVAAEFALEWYEAQEAGDIKSNLRGIGLGDPWISPLDSVQSWGSYLFSAGAVDTQGKEAIESSVKLITNAAIKGFWRSTTSLTSETVDLIDDLTCSMSFQNIIDRVEVNHQTSTSDLFEEIITNRVAPALEVNVTWGKMKGYVFSRLAGDFMKNVTHIVEQLIQQKDIEVFVYTSQLNYFIPTIGTVTWVDRILEKTEWRNAPRKGLIIDHVVQGFSKELDNFKMYWISRAGRNVPGDNPAAMKAILNHMIEGKSHA